MSLSEITDTITQELYIESADGTKLSAYIFFPNDFSQQDTTFPVIWKHDRYHSINRANNQLQQQTAGVDYGFFITQGLAQGFVIAVVDSRGSGCSFGSTAAPFSQAEKNDLKAVSDWFAQQPWCTGKVGMFGRSYSGIIQFFSCVTPSKSLKTIIPEMALFDLYEFVNPGGIFRNNFADRWAKNTFDLDNLLPFKPINGESGLHLAENARQQHQSNVDIFKQFHSMPYRDSKYLNGEKYYELLSPSHYIEAINKSAIPIFQVAGWFDLWVKDALILHRNLTGAKKLLIGPWAHGGAENDLLVKEQFAWFEQHLKNSDHCDNQNEIRYFTIGAPQDQSWKLTKEWPLGNTHYTSCYLTHQSLENSQTLNDHVLTTEDKGLASDGFVAYEANYTTSSGKTSRWANGYGGDYYYPDMESLCSLALNYTMDVNSDDIEITGHPIVKLFLSANVPDVDIFIYLFDVYPDNYVQYMTEGCLRASRRKLINAPYENFSLPYISGKQEDLLALNKDEITLLEIDLQPISYLIKKNHRLRLTITCCDKDNLHTPIIRPLPLIRIYSNAAQQSQIILPVIPSE